MATRSGSRRSRPTAAEKKAVVDQSVELARQVGAGEVDPRDIEAEAVKLCRELVGFVDGPADPLWELHGEIARAYLAAGGMPAHELYEWAAVQARAESATLGATPVVRQADTCELVSTMQDVPAAAVGEVVDTLPASSSDAVSATDAPQMDAAMREINALAREAWDSKLNSQSYGI